MKFGFNSASFLPGDRELLHTGRSNYVTSWAGGGKANLVSNLVLAVRRLYDLVRGPGFGRCDPLACLNRGFLIGTRAHCPTLNTYCGSPMRTMVLAVL